MAGADYRTVALAQALLDPPQSWRLDAVWPPSQPGPVLAALRGGALPAQPTDDSNQKEI